MNLRRAAFPEAAPADIRDKVEANKEANAAHRKHMMLQTRMARFGGAPSLSATAELVAHVGGTGEAELGESEGAAELVAHGGGTGEAEYMSSQKAKGRPS